jgi:hypothetical protein
MRLRCTRALWRIAPGLTTLETVEAVRRLSNLGKCLYDAGMLWADFAEREERAGRERRKADFLVFAEQLPPLPTGVMATGSANGLELRTALENLGRCLRDAGALCSAFADGWEQRGRHADSLRYPDEGREPWQPGCGRALWAEEKKS